MRVCNEDVRDGFAAYCVEQRRSVRGIVRARIDDRDLAASDDVADRALEGEWPRIVCDNPANPRRDLFGAAGFQIEDLIIGDVVRHEPAPFAATRLIGTDWSSPGWLARHISASIVANREDSDDARAHFAAGVVPARPLGGERRGAELALRSDPLASRGRGGGPPGPDLPRDWGGALEKSRGFRRPPETSPAQQP